MATPVQMPKQGNTVEECLITEWSVKEGDAVKEGDILCVIETDKATFEVESPSAGTVLKCFWADGDLVPVLVNIAVIGEPGEDTDAFAPESTAPPAAAPAASPAPSTTPTAAAGDGEERISPRARREAADLGVSTAGLSGSGPLGRIISRDVQAAAASGRLTPLARQVADTTGQVAGTATGLGGRVRARDLVSPSAPAESVQEDAVEVPYKGIRKLIGDRMRASLADHAQLTLNGSADASALLSLRKRLKAQGEALGLPNITLNDMIMYVVAQTLPRFPEVNAVFDAAAATVRQHRTSHLALAVDTERGLMVPVIPRAEQYSLGALSLALAETASACRAGNIDPDRLQGGTFTVTNLGAMGVESFTPVLNSPQVAILGICSIEQRAAPCDNGGVRFVPTMGLSLTIDHQVVDGAPAARFLQAVAQGMANIDLLLTT